MVDVEVMVLDVGEHRAREREALVEGLAQLRREQRAVLLGDALTLGQCSFARARDVLAGVESRDVGADRLDREPGVVDPRAVVVVEDAGPAGEVEPRVLGLLEVGEPPFAGVAAGEGSRRARPRSSALATCSETPSSTASRASRRSSSSGRRTRTSIAGHHLRDGLVRDVRESLSASLVEGEVRPVAEAQELEVVLEDAVDPLEEAVVRVQERVARSEPAAIGDDRLVLDLGHLRDLEPGELRRGGLDLFQPALVQLVPVLVVVAGPPREQLRPAFECRLVGDRVRTEVDVAVQESALVAEGGREDEEA